MSRSLDQLLDELTNQVGVLSSYSTFPEVDRHGDYRFLARKQIEEIRAEIHEVAGIARFRA